MVEGLLKSTHVGASGCRRVRVRAGGRVGQRALRVADHHDDPGRLRRVLLLQDGGRLHQRVRAAERIRLRTRLC